MALWGKGLLSTAVVSTAVVFVIEAVLQTTGTLIIL